MGVEPIGDDDLAALRERLDFHELAWAEREAAEPGFQRAMLVHFDEMEAVLARLIHAEIELARLRGESVGLRFMVRVMRDDHARASKPAGGERDA